MPLVTFHDLGYAECTGRPTRFAFACPRRPGHRCAGLLIEGGPLYDGVVTRGPGRHCWAWNGDRVKPTFTPSINCLTHNPKDPAEKYAGCGWHGHITNGKIVG